MANRGSRLATNSSKLGHATQMLEKATKTSEYVGIFIAIKVSACVDDQSKISITHILMLNLNVTLNSDEGAEKLLFTWQRLTRNLILTALILKYCCAHKHAHSECRHENLHCAIWCETEELLPFSPAPISCIQHGGNWLYIVKRSQSKQCGECRYNSRTRVKQADLSNVNEPSIISRSQRDKEQPSLAAKYPPGVT